jgi:hypothetical protein
LDELPEDASPGLVEHLKKFGIGPRVSGEPTRKTTGSGAPIYKNTTIPSPVHKGHTDLQSFDSKGKSSVTPGNQHRTDKGLLDWAREAHEKKK